ncbi:hypothetical protein [Williamsia sp. CHRR-6]|uniref:hypothetical protein n=1 Tax=Williamsia sp. CHRR-6 TaxID=2835871 RepID=UPI001BDA942D|nr:hypothetical protein [Williamsia sp. CHRR-6]MBT0567728.1 hypothetical protein [Williamsia sp. CHRR-6]
MTNHDTDILATLKHFRDDVPDMPMSSYAAIHGQVFGASTPRATRRSGTVFTRGRVAVAAAAVVVAAAGAFGVTGLLGSSTTTPTADAATILQRAGSSAQKLPPLQVAPTGWIYREVVRQNGLTVLTERSWQRADGSQPGRVVTTTTGAPSAFDGTRTLPVTAATSPVALTDRSYLALQGLTDDPQTLITDIRNDPRTRADISKNGTTSDVAAWEQVRELAEILPADKQDTLFTAAKEISGLTVVRGVTDAAGRPGTALQISDPRLGSIGLIFSDTDGRFLGERITNPGSGSVMFSSSVVRVAAVAAIGVVPVR